MTKQTHRVTIYEYARECSPFADEDLHLMELVDKALDEGLIDRFDDVPGIYEEDNVMKIKSEDEEEARAFLLQQIGDYRDFLDVEVFRSTSNPDNWIVDFLLTCGGPTVRVTVDSRWESVTLFHSWGYHDHLDCECEEWEISGQNRYNWLEMAENFAAC